MLARNSFLLGFGGLVFGMAQPGLALTAQELWSEWQSQMEATGQTVTAEQVVAGDGVLTITGYTTRSDDPGLSLVNRLDALVMTETGDGSVVITMSDSLSVEARFVPEAGMTPVTAQATVAIPGLRITASGTVENRIYEYDAPRILITDGPLSGGDGPLPEIDYQIAIDDFTALYQIDGSDPDDLGYQNTSAMAGVTGALRIVPPQGEEGRLKLSFALGANTGTGSGRLGDMTALGAAPDAFPTGLAFAADVAYDSARIEIGFEHPSDAFTLRTANQGGRLSASLSEAAMAYRMSATGSSVYFLGPDLPVPLDLSLASGEMAFSVPLSQAAAPQPVAARLAYQEVVVTPELWALIDPAAALPRDPISVVADVAGSVRILRNLFATDPTEMAALPAELVDLTLNELRLAIAGAELTGRGRAEFAPGPIPMPVGAVDLQLRGANALMDRLQAAGLVPIEQLAMARGFLAALTRPGAAPDTVESTIAFTQGGGITANGVPLR